MKFRRKAGEAADTAGQASDETTSGSDASTHAPASGPFDVSEVEGDGTDRADLAHRYRRAPEVAVADG